WFCHGQALPPSDQPGIKLTGPRLPRCERRIFRPMRGNTDRRGKNEILIRKEEVVEGGHHGGSWKVAYADFVTAMMAFFLLMWLLNATTEEQRKGLADYFSPNSVLSHNSSVWDSPLVAAPRFPTEPCFRTWGR